MLPDAKDGFPKCLYLDQNKWIDLSRAHYGRPDGEAFQPALKAVRQAVQSGRLVVPISIVNLLEATSHKEPERRERLARFMVDLSGNLAILPFMVVYPWEIKNAVRAKAEYRGTSAKGGIFGVEPTGLDFRGHRAVRPAC